MERSIGAFGRLHPCASPEGSNLRTIFGDRHMAQSFPLSTVNPFTQACPSPNLIRQSNYWQLVWKQRFLLKNGKT